jgi:hypothetical protein
VSWTLRQRYVQAYMVVDVKDPTLSKQLAVSTGRALLARNIIFLLLVLISVRG